MLNMRLKLALLMCLTAAALYSHGRDGSHKPVLLSRCFEEEDSGFTGGGFPFRGRGIITGGKL